MKSIMHVNLKFLIVGSLRNNIFSQTNQVILALDSLVSYSSVARSFN